MKKFIIAASAIVGLFLVGILLYNRAGWFVDLHPTREPAVWLSTYGGEIQITQDGAQSAFEIRGVDLGSAVPGKWPTDYAIDKSTYLLWFGQIQEMGANTIRVYALQKDTFYNLQRFL